ncbi:MAG: dephospho-CoA kinase [Firmicutes bacterium]|nr:dephospho-CoA kinase [Bacillota bacterium]
MKLIGVTGPIASGKTMVASLLEEKGAVVINADQIAREVVEPGKPAWHEVVDQFGQDILNEDHNINRRKLGNIVFNNPEKLAILNKIIHPPVIAEIDRRIEEIEKKYMDGKIVIADVPLLIEVGMHKKCDLTVVVTADRQIRIDRLIRQGLTKDEAESRINSQKGKEALEKEADVVIQNNGSLEELKAKVNELWQQIKGFADSGSGSNPQS